MARFSVPVDFDIETLKEHGFEDYISMTVDLSSVEFFDKETLSANNTALLVFDEGIKSFCDLIGISYMYVKKLPDDLFAYTMNYFLRRSEGVSAEINFDNTFVVGSVHFSDVFRLKLTDIVELINESSGYSDLKMVEFFHKSGNYKITVVGERIEEDGSMTVFPAVTVHINDKLYGHPSYWLSIYRWGPMISDPEPFLTTQVRKKDSPDSVLTRVREGLSSTFSQARNWAEYTVKNAKANEVNNPTYIVGKILSERGYAKKRGEIMKGAGINDVVDNSYRLAYSLSDYANRDGIRTTMKDRLEKTAGYIALHMQSDHRCDKCMSHIED